MSVLFYSVLYYLHFIVFFFFKQKTAYEMRISDWSSDVCSSDLYNSGFSYTPQNTVTEPSYTLVNGRVSYFFIPWNLRLTAFGKNLTKEHYHYSKFQTDFGVNQTLAPPIQYGLRLEWTY